MFHLLEKVEAKEQVVGNCAFLLLNTRHFFLSTFVCGHSARLLPSTKPGGGDSTWSASVSLALWPQPLLSPPSPDRPPSLSLAQRSLVLNLWEPPGASFKMLVCALNERNEQEYKETERKETEEFKAS